MCKASHDTVGYAPGKLWKISKRAFWQNFKRRNFRKSISMGFIEFVRPVDKKNSMGFTTSGILQNDVISL